MAEIESTPQAGEALVKQEKITREELTRVRQYEAEHGTPWYRYLLQMGKVSFDVVEDILKMEFHPKSAREEHQTLGQTLVKMKALSDEQLKGALAEQNRSGRLLGNILLDKGFVTRRIITRALAKQHDLEYADLEATPSEPLAIDAVPESVAIKNQMLPVRLEKDKLTILIPHPQVLESIREVGIMMAKRMYPILTTVDNMRDVIAERYRLARQINGSVEESHTAPHSATPDRATSAQSQTVSIINKGEVPMETPDVLTEQGRLKDIARQASGVPVVKLVSTIIEGAINAGATDIHLDPQEPQMRVRYRIDGILHDVMSIPAETQNVVISRIKIMSDMDITETRHPQDGHLSLSVNHTEYDVRVATLPTFLGERVVLRLLDQTSVLSGVKDLGLEPEDEKTLLRVISQPYGMILVTGPTGSGKTTTLYASLNQKNVMTDSIVTLEDPVEYQLSGINQVQVEADIDLTFANILRAALRQDIDVLLVGEIRDPETARTAIRAAMTGHLVFSTLHTNDAPEAITTFRNMGIPSYLIASALTAVVGQRLVRRICPKCKTEYKPAKTLLKSIGLAETTKSLYKGNGCEYCYHTGYKGRTGIFEIIEVTPSIRKMIAAEEPIEKIVTAGKFKNMGDRCLLKVKRGDVAPDEFLRVIRI